MSIRSQLQSTASGEASGKFFSTWYDRKNTRRWNHATSRWKTTVSSADAKVNLTELASPELGQYAADISGMGAPGQVFEYFHNNDTGLVIAANRRFISDGAFAGDPDAATVNLAARFEVIGSDSGFQDDTYWVRLKNKLTGNVWNHVTRAWASSVALNDSKVWLTPDAISEYANVYGDDVEGLGDVEQLVASYYNQLTSETQPIAVEEYRVSQGSIAAGAGPYKVAALKAHGVLTEAERLDPSNQPDLELVVLAGTSCTVLLRLVDGSGVAILPAAISSIRYTITEKRDFDPAYRATVDGHKAVSVPTSALYDVLLVDYLWGSTDTKGYNFRHELDLALGDAFAEAGRKYELVYTFTPASGQVIKQRLIVRTV